MLQLISYLGMSSQFKIYSHGWSDTLGVKYDYNSIMHYGNNFFGKISKDKSRILTTIKTKYPKYQNVIGQRRYLSKGDLLLVNKMYGCPGKRCRLIIIVLYNLQ
jgi:meprin A/meprin B